MRHVRTDDATRRVAIIGTGLMGGSLGLALRCFTSGYEVVAYDRDPETLNLSLELGVCDEIASSAGGAARGADIIVVAVPVDELEAVLTEISEARLDPNVTVTDLCSVKRFPVRLGQRLLGGRFVGGHPMAGSQKSGAASANPDLLPRATWFLTPTAGTSEAALAEVARLVRSIGTRVATSKPDFWLPLLEANRDQVWGHSTISLSSSLPCAMPLPAIREASFIYISRKRESSAS